MEINSGYEMKKYNVKLHNLSEWKTLIELTGQEFGDRKSYPKIVTISCRKKGINYRPYEVKNPRKFYSFDEWYLIQAMQI